MALHKMARIFAEGRLYGTKSAWLGFAVGAGRDCAGVDFLNFRE